MNDLNAATGPQNGSEPGAIAHSQTSRPRFFAVDPGLSDESGISCLDVERSEDLRNQPLSFDLPYGPVTGRISSNSPALWTHHLNHLETEGR